MACSSASDGSPEDSGGSGGGASSSGGPQTTSTGEGSGVSSSTSGAGSTTTATSGSGGGASSSSSSSAGGAGGASSSSSSAETSSGSGGSPETGFQPCPATGPCKILPLGDSITVGLGFDGGYRVELFHLATQDDHEVTFTGTQQMNGPAMVDGKPFPRNHEGISGETIEQIAKRIPMGLREMPHIVLLHAGTNDMYREPNGADTRLGALIDELIAEAPDALIVVSNIIPFPMGAGAVNTYNAKIPALVEARASKGAHVLFVDQFKDFPTSELGDGVHPNKAGYARMAGRWYDAISDYLR
ncbi:SGNH/GDSL hydrolase family protein [Sorangium sp. So ce281]|uniref:SGNH/GDSL hydrolase family protein n=1 Tax=Sorangium sp. So ce281 TaxID=3133293 RepID=UPI003F5EEF7E